MGTINGKNPTVWMRSIKYHTYEGLPQDVGACYLAHEEMVETIEILKFAVKDTPPRTAVRESVAIQPSEPEPTTKRAGVPETPVGIALKKGADALRQRRVQPYTTDTP